jgi:hypothetical protein
VHGVAFERVWGGVRMNKICKVKLSKSITPPAKRKQWERILENALSKKEEEIKQSILNKIQKRILEGEL